MSTLLSRIEQEYPKFSKSHKRIADFILNDYQKAAYYTAAKLGEVTDISESTVVRFAAQLGFEGFPEFQAALRDDIKGKLTTLQRMEVASFKMLDEDVLEKVMRSDRDAIKETLANVSHDDFKAAAAAINDADRIYILGVRSAAPLANFMNFYLKMVYDNVVLITSASSSEEFENIFKIRKEDVCIAISFPRYSKQVVTTLEYAKEKGAKIIAVTDSDSSPIAPLATYLLKAKSNMASFTDSLVAPLSLINALIVEATIGKRDEVLGTFAELESIWDKYDVYEKTEDSDNE
ncbi:MAG: MurR/RpiR family transcriptional regulator [Clostridia bacterium]|nr:MurR/RpiR family transcriptional regulator [Clostridia bacterium]MBQ2092154.1 MurR/RpiR family transcriptional regulator [Clostridia bacterium]MBQ3896877.1 MurR/RpiR family transcriptional regulator [Clostridia bacterium]